MDPITDLDAAQAAVGAACALVDAVREAEFWRLTGRELLDLAVGVERLGRLVFAVQVSLAGELDTQGVAVENGCVSTAALLRQSLVISAAEAKNRVETARAVLPRDGVSGGEIPPTLPLLGEALAAGAIGLDQTRTIVAAMKQIPAQVDRETRELVQVELTIGVRNPDSGMTRFHGQLDDVGVEVLSQAIDGLAKPRPATTGDTAGGGTGGDAGGNAGSAVGNGVGPGTPDRRSAACRRGQAFVEALRRCPDAGTGPIQGGERPHVTVTISLDDLRTGAGVGYLEFGGVIDSGIARMLACDAAIIPAVLGSASQVLDVGMASRSFPTAIRRAIALRDKGCAFPGCDRPPGWADCHHIVHWVNHGPSSLANGCLLCPAHHAEIHRGYWEVRMAADGLPEFRPPPWVDKDRKPRRNKSHHIETLLGL